MTEAYLEGTSTRLYTEQRQKLIRARYIILAEIISQGAHGITYSHWPIAIWLLYMCGTIHA